MAHMRELHSPQTKALYADVLRTMPSKAIELASFDLYKKVLSVNKDGKGRGGVVTSLAGAMAGWFFNPPDPTP